MTAFSHTDWTVNCDYRYGEGYGERCMEQGRTDLVLGATTARELRRMLKRGGWAVNLPGPNGRRLDYCPKHKREARR